MYKYNRLYYFFLLYAVQKCNTITQIMLFQINSRDVGYAASKVTKVLRYHFYFGIERPMTLINVYDS